MEAPEVWKHPLNKSTFICLASVQSAATCALQWGMASVLEYLMSSAWATRMRPPDYPTVMDMSDGVVMGDAAAYEECW